LQKLHEEIVASDLAYAPGAALERKLAGQFLHEKKSSPPFRSGMWLGAAVLAAAIGVVTVLISIPALRSGGGAGAIAAEILDNHLRALQAVHQVDVPSSDQHTVKPWFAGKLDFSPDVRDLAPQGFPLAGGRVEYLAGRCVAALIYHGAGTSSISSSGPKGRRPAATPLSHATGTICSIGPPGP
jgi:anti-sigma factor RsiW